ncbi:hypothetical protein LG329_09935 [Virgibacillus necropolis]|uniref:hypothetical protein n=1 Tax=Virgibacillus necropolis TaxID=163877 RepID=UPI00384D46BA
MRRTAYLMLMVLAVTTIITYVPSKSFACSCAEPGTVTEVLNRDGATVFSGRVVKKVDQSKLDMLQSSADPISVLFQVDKTWKGVNQSQVIVKTARSSASCGYEFTLNERYLVYASERDGELNVNLCSRTQSITDAQADLEVLGMGKDPTEKVHLEDQMTGMSMMVIVTWAVLGIVGVSGIILIRRLRS